MRGMHQPGVSMMALVWSVASSALSRDSGIAAQSLDRRFGILPLLRDWEERCVSNHGSSKSRLSTAVEEMVGAW